MIWRAIAWVVSRRPINDWIVTRALRAPLSCLPGSFWRWAVCEWPCIRLHLFSTADGAPLGDSRLVVLSGGYAERRGDGRTYTLGVGDTSPQGRHRRVVEVGDLGATVLVFPRR